MALQNGVYETAVEMAERHLVGSGAQLVKKEAGRQVYVSKITNQTFMVTPLRQGVVRVQVIGGCVC